jgi:hypothetical protein
MSYSTVKPQEGLCRRLMFHLADRALRNDTPAPLVNGRRLSEEEMRRLVDYAHQQGFSDTPLDGATQDRALVIGVRALETVAALPSFSHPNALLCCLRPVERQ